MANDDVAQQLSSSWKFGTDPSTEQSFQQFAAQGQSFFDAARVSGPTPAAFPARTTTRILPSWEGRPDHGRQRRLGFGNDVE